jgi:hypothetical protein
MFFRAARGGIDGRDEYDIFPALEHFHPFCIIEGFVQHIDQVHLVVVHGVQQDTGGIDGDGDVELGIVPGHIVHHLWHPGLAQAFDHAQPQGRCRRPIVHDPLQFVHFLEDGLGPSGQFFPGGCQRHLSAHPIKQLHPQFLFQRMYLYTESGL